MPYRFITIPRVLWLWQLQIPLMGPVVGGIGAIMFDSWWPLIIGLAFGVMIVSMIGLIYVTYFTLAETIEIVPERKLFLRRVRWMKIQSSGTALHLDYVRGLHSGLPEVNGDIVKAYSDMFSKKSGAIALQYGAQTYRFGMFTTEAESRMVVGELLKRFPELALPQP